MTTAATISAKLILDTSDYDKGLDSAKKKADGFSKTLGGLAAVGGGVIAAVGLAGATMGGMAIATGMAAAEVEQMTMVSGLMAKNAGWSADMIEEQRKALRSSGITAGGTEKALQSLMAAQLDVTTATDLSRLAQNLAVKTGEDSTQTFLALVDGIERADSRMLKSAGITVDLAKAQQDLADELGKTVGELTSAEKQQAAFNAVIEQSPIYDGLYEAAMEHPIKQMGSLKRLFNDVAVGIGSHFTPAISNVIAGFSTFVKHIIEVISEGGALEPFLIGIGEVFNRIGEQVGNALIWMGENISLFIEKVQVAWAWLQENEGVIVGIFAAIGAAIAAFVYTVILPAVASVITALAPVIAVMALVGAAAYLLYEAWTNNWLGIQEITQVVIEFLKEFISNALIAIRTWWDEHGEAIMGIVRNMWDIVKTIFQTVSEFVAGIIRGFLTLIQNWWDEHGELVMEIVQLLWNKIKEIIDNVTGAIMGIVGPFLEKIKAWWAEHGDAIMEKTQAIWDTVLGIFEWFGEQFGILLQAFKAAIEGDWEMFGEKLREIWDNIWESIKDIVSNAWDWLKEAIPQLIETIINFFKETDWPQVGIDIVKGIADGINAGAKWAINAITNLAKAMWDSLTGFFKSSSPSRLMAGLGDDLDKGLAIGIESSAKLPIKEMNKMSENLISNLPFFDNSLSSNSLSNLSVPGGTRGTLSSGASGVARMGAQTVNNFNFTANYPMQRETDLITDLKIQEALRA